ncbi:MAG: hypothetical protein RL594_1078 [Bacteroidota bacterium]|jgi:cystathionine beta-synthase
MNVNSTVLDLIGRTPLVRLNALARDIKATVLLKLESRNPGGSIKDRIGIALIEDAEKSGRLKPGSLIIEPTSGNTGIGLTIAARLKGYPCLLVTTDKASVERVRYIKALGGEVLIMPSAAKPSSPEYYVNTAQRLAGEIPGAVILNQYDNPANAAVHERTTGPEIWEDTDGKITHFVAGMGTGGTISGTARYLKRMNPNIKIIAGDPVGSSLKVFKDTGRLIESLPYLIEGVGQDHVPDNLDLNLVDEIININDKEAFAMARQLARQEGILCGGSSGMNVAAALRIAATLDENAVVVVIICDTGERYLTKHHSDEWLQEKNLLDRERITVRDVIESKRSRGSLPSVISVPPSATISEALALMSSYEVSDVPVVHDEQLQGMIREARLMSAVINDRDVLASSVTSIMEPACPEVDIHNDVQTAIQLLRNAPLVAVSEFGRISGILTRHDVLEYL